MSEDARKLLLSLYQTAIKAVEGRNAVARALENDSFENPPYLVALGKAAASMLQGAVEQLDDQFAQALLVTKYGHGDRQLEQHPRITCLESAHPYPDENSLKAGQQLIEFIQQVPADGEFLFLISGGASALVEHLAEGITLEDLDRVSHWLLASGLPIDQMNQVRKSLSLIKGGGLLSYLRGRKARCLVISDVPGDELGVIGSGPLVSSPAIDKTLLKSLPQWLQALIAKSQKPDSSGCDEVPHQIVANNQIACDAVENRAQSLEIPVYRYPFLDGDSLEMAREIAKIVKDAPSGIHLWGGETTIHLPDNPGRGGRCQAMALAAAKELSGFQGVTFLAAGSDGTDGPGEDAGAIVDGATLERGSLSGMEAEDYLDRADAGTFLEESGDLIQTGPTGTNVMDLVIVQKVSTNS